jgi:archaemetzincin
VFGEARLRGGIGVWSFARLGSSDPAQRTRRCFKLVAHEIGHTFGMEHCIRFECNMNGSNSRNELDRQPLHLCPLCLKKLRWNRGFKHAKRCGELLDFYRRSKLDEETRWVTSAISYLRTFRSSK